MSDSDKNGQKAFDNRQEKEISSGNDVSPDQFIQAGMHESNAEVLSTRPAEHQIDAAEESNSATGCGQLLRAERLKRGLSVGEVARRLRLSAQQVNAIEEEDYSKFPSSTFLRGFVRNYGSLLQLDANALLRLLAQTAPQHAQQSSARQIKTIPLVSSKRGGGGRGVLFSTMVLILALLGYGWYQGADRREDSLVKKGIEAPAPFDSQAENGQVTMELLLPQTSAAPSPSADKAEPVEKRPLEMEPAPVMSTEVEPVVTEEMESKEKTLHFVFDKESWVEIRDGSKKVIFVKMNGKGTEQMLTGTPPLYLVVGNASGVNLTYNGKLVDLAPYTRKNDDVARFSLE